MVSSFFIGFAAGSADKGDFFYRMGAMLFDGSRASPYPSWALARTRVFAGVTHPRTPGFTFGRPKVNRKTTKTKVLDSFS